MDLRARDGGPLVPWHDAESAFAAWQECSRGRPCDYTGLSDARLRGGSGIPWPCDAEHPDGTERLYAGGRFWAAPDVCESYGRDLVTGAPLEPAEYRALNPDGRAVIKAAEYVPPHELPSEDFPLPLVTGRTVYHFHTRTKTGRAPELRDAAPDVWVEVAPADAEALGLAEGDLAEVASPRGEVRARVRVGGIRTGVVFLPFHYGYWDTEGGDGPGQHGRAANELTITEWDPCSKQPLFKTAAVRVRRVAAGDGPAPAPTTAASRPVGEDVPATRGGASALVDERTPGAEAS